MSIGLAVLICFLLWLMVVSPGFRVVAFICIGVLGVGLAAVIISNQKTPAQATWTDYKKDPIVPPLKEAELSISELNLGHMGFGPSKLSLMGRVKNNSQYRTLTGMRFRLFAMDCPSPASQPTDCETVGETTAYFTSDVPPGQVRAIDNRFVEFKDMPAVRAFKWRYKIDSISSK